jgi:hypothetical protein
VHEQVSSPADRRARGAWYTPRSLVEGLVDLTVPEGRVPRLVIDPTCGGGAFLLAALDRLVALGLDPEEALTRVTGMDLDPGAVQAARWSIHLWAGPRLGWDRARELACVLDLIEGDALVDWPERWRGKVVVVGNPPFASPLRSGAVPASAGRYRTERAELLGPYADLGAIHLLHAVERAGAGSTVTLVQPQSILASRDTEPMRRHLDRMAPRRALWVARELLFDAGVRACAPVLEVGAEVGEGIELYCGPAARPVGRAPRGHWTAAAADALGAPRLELPTAGTLGELVEATAGFRDEHYGLVGACREADPVAGPVRGEGWVVTVGAVDPLTAEWGRSPIRFGGRHWSRPVVDPNALPPKVQRWFDRLARPKILLATQAKVLEPVIDRTGRAVPATPLIAVLAEPDELDRVAAVLLAPPVSLWAWRRWFGTALTVDALKLAAAQVKELPLPTDAGAWAEAAALLAHTDRHNNVGGRAAQEGIGVADPASAWDLALEVATIMNRAYGAGSEVLEWWSARRKARPVPTAARG